ncbi:radical SAM family heme chaperone HemW [Rhodopseudomonas palustris]|uniref:radical SAM family heme chaperone HemW n=1 Tax=Rhodopseudomonas palustris TaxID=1076 RepID=UPI00142F0217
MHKFVPDWETARGVIFVETLTTPVTPAAVRQNARRDDGAYVFHHPPKFTWSNVALPPLAWNHYSLYLHVPFCRAICTFCTFERTQYSKSSMDAFFDALLDEVDLREQSDDFTQATLDSIYLGGGTASLLSNEQISQFLGRLRSGFGLHDDIECTLECEPGTKREDDFREVRDAGVNRVSIGVQSFSDQLLPALNRRHTVATSYRTIEAAHNAGFSNIHIDLMYGLPNQTLADWKFSVNEAIRLGIQHVSVYRLIIFQDELLARKLGQGELQPPADAGTIEEMRRYALETLPANGLRQYSLTEFAKPGNECIYVQRNWDGSDYLGFGPAAYSRHAHHLWENTVFHHRYHELTDDHRLPVGKGITMTPHECLARDVAMGLCLLSVDIAHVERQSGASLDEIFGRKIAQLVDDGLLRRTRDRIYLTDEGLLYATYIMKRFTA